MFSYLHPRPNWSRLMVPPQAKDCLAAENSLGRQFAIGEGVLSPKSWK